jgi:hypothetical protein
MRKVRSVSPLSDHRLLLGFDNGEQRVFDVKPYINRGIFIELKDPSYFGKVRVFMDSICWPNGQDFDPDHMYIESSEHQDSEFHRETA